MNLPFRGLTSIVTLKQASARLFPGQMTSFPLLRKENSSPVMATSLGMFGLGAGDAASTVDLGVFEFVPEQEDARAGGWNQISL